MANNKPSKNPIFAMIAQQDNVLLITGEMSFKTVADLAKKLDEFIEAGKDIVINLEGVTHSDSSALVLMIHCYRFALNRRKSLHFKAIPNELLEVAKLCGIGALLPQ